MKSFILASASPRRRDILNKLGINPVIEPTDADETIERRVSPSEYVKELSIRKANAYPRELDDDEILIAADTVVAMNDEILGKPSDEDDARRMLNLLSGNIHSVFTGITVRSKERTVTVSEETKVGFRELCRNEIEDYIKSGEPMDKAGAYGIQGEAGKFVSFTDGELDNVIGLPSGLLVKILKENFNTEIGDING